MDGLLEIVLRVLFAPVIWCIQALVGVLHPLSSPKLVAAQRVCLAALAIAATALVTLCVAIAWGTTWRLPLMAFAVWFVSAAAGGLAGKYIETKSRESSQPNP